MNDNITTKKYFSVTVELDQHTGEFYIDMSVREYWYAIKYSVEPTRSSSHLEKYDELVTCRTFELERGVRWSTENEYEAVTMAALVQEGLEAGVNSIKIDPEFAAMQFDYIVAAHEASLPYRHLAMA